MAQLGRRVFCISSGQYDNRHDHAFYVIFSGVGLIDLLEGFGLRWGHMLCRTPLVQGVAGPAAAPHPAVLAVPQPSCLVGSGRRGPRALPRLRSAFVLSEATPSRRTPRPPRSQRPPWLHGCSTEQGPQGQASSRRAQVDLAATSIPCRMPAWFDGHRRMRAPSPLCRE